AFTRGQLQAVGRLLELERQGKVDGPNFAIVGPWNHGGTHFLDHPPYDRWITEWYRYWLDRGPRPAWFDGPRVTYCEMKQARDGECVWRHSNAWPPPETRYRRYYLTPDRSLVGAGSLRSAGIRRDQRLASWDYNPLAGQGEDLFSKWDNAANLPQRDADQREDEWKGLTFTTAPLRRDLSIAGPITLSLRATTQPLIGGASPDLGPIAAALGAPGLAQLVPPYHDTDFVVKLSDVAPGGASTLIQSGFLRASHGRLDRRRSGWAGTEVIEPFYRHTRASLAPPRPGVPRTYKIEIWPTAKRFAAGHRVRIALYSADTANHLTLLKPAHNTVLGGSYLLLPVRPRR